MSNIEVILKEGNPVDPAKPKGWRISLPANVTMKQLLKDLIPKLGLPTQQRDGRQLVYKLHHVQSDKTLNDNETLFGAGVANKDTCLLLRVPAKEYVSRVTESVTSKPKKVEVMQGKKTPVNIEEYLREAKAVPMIDVPPDLLYTNQHIWFDRTLGRVGITDFLAKQFLTVVDVILPELGYKVAAGQEVSTMWVVYRSAIDELNFPIPSPVTGTVFEVNKRLRKRFLRSAETELILFDPYGDGWLFSIVHPEEVRSDLERLMDAKAYLRYIGTLLKKPK